MIAATSGPISPSLQLTLGAGRQRTRDDSSTDLNSQRAAEAASLDQRTLARYHRSTRGHSMTPPASRNVRRQRRTYC
jgi:hypothetical protein